MQQVLEKVIHLGGSLDPNSCFLLSRGLKTLQLRVQRQNATALALAQWLQQQPQVAAVHYPGLPSHPQHQRACELFASGGWGGVLSFELADGQHAAERLLQARISTLAVLLLPGDVTWQCVWILQPGAPASKPDVNPSCNEINSCDTLA